MIDLTQRAAPKQRRSRETIDLLLKVSVDLLAEVGVDRFNTNLLAERAGVGPRAIYRYFPNKWALLLALMKSYREAEQGWMGDLERFATTQDWRALVDETIDRYFEAARREPGYAALRKASRASAELRDYEAEAGQEAAARLSGALRNLIPDLPDAQRTLMCRAIIEAINGIIDLSLDSTRAEAAQLLGHAKLMAASLIAYHRA